MGGFKATVMMVIQDEYQTVCPVPPTTWDIDCAKKPDPMIELSCATYMKLTA